ncbi:MAG: hypothetical protein COZ06_05375 [Armatimonadetes bacterium CG_4_10_14_3_um_filter_66_18]|nr:MAG: hypothetical protein AUJ96_03855 [Armatimonadetes bacterium CG2_30_66_41]PIU91488.1 MAG: hypothetical protein COS65_21820 [Armatimonadetes bacterium CG06_land_8_20_14_3_00_66_21]PIX36978.1 MAG: hypothetical protein COZ57_36655 [Armatimonadetes bacterium CG_4_8_14_3_um_filter_66_20]PIY51200.1 MAG: hypothetical protein COZ06_05375 [Armatimonadetes bacterium CG_4_10_14_3_um_filter_66_18]PIZ32429.1 MAG: hypothetical protein COY42_31245 [Armatimonadetes bacterium CG_4_10_14_0_8_um_filter_66_
MLGLLRAKGLVSGEWVLVTHQGQTEVVADLLGQVKGAIPGEEGQAAGILASKGTVVHGGGFGRREGAKAARTQLWAPVSRSNC